VSFNVLALVGSLRATSTHRVLFVAACELAPAGLAVSEFAGLGDLPLYNGDLDVEPRPESVEALAAAMRASQGILLVSPEYNYSIPGVLKNALDWMSRGGPRAPLRGKPVAIMGGSSGISGGMRMQYHLRQSLVFTDNPVLVQPEVILPRIQERIVDGRLADESTRALVAKQMVAFETWIGRFVTSP
jgi:chromate reductase